MKVLKTFEGGPSSLGEGSQPGVWFKVEGLKLFRLRVGVLHRDEVGQLGHVEQVEQRETERERERECVSVCERESEPQRERARESERAGERDIKKERMCESLCV